jgi:hypothetical protein
MYIVGGHSIDGNVAGCGYGYGRSRIHIVATTLSRADDLGPMVCRDASPVRLTIVVKKCFHCCEAIRRSGVLLALRGHI